MERQISALNIPEGVELSFPPSPKPPEDIPVNGWSNDVEKILDNIRVNCIALSSNHKIFYNKLKNKLKYYKIPVIVFGSVNTVLSISLEAYTEWASVIICFINLVITILSGIEMFLGIQKGIESNYILQRGYYTLAIDIFKNLRLERKNRKINGIEYLDNCMDEYHKLFETSSKQKICDRLIPIKDELETPDSSTIHEEIGV